MMTLPFETEVEKNLLLKLMFNNSIGIISKQKRSWMRNASDHSSTCCLMAFQMRNIMLGFQTLDGYYSPVVCLGSERTRYYCLIQLFKFKIQLPKWFPSQLRYSTHETDKTYPYTSGWNKLKFIPPRSHFFYSQGSNIFAAEVKILRYSLGS